VTATPPPPSNTLEVYPDETLGIDDPILGGKDIIQTPPQLDTRPSDIPNGWLKKDRPMYSAQIIISFSLGLASVIALLIVACAIMRHRRNKFRKLLKAKALQQQQSHSLDSHADDSGGVAEDPNVSLAVKRKKKRWMKGALNWRINAHLTMKRRRPKGGLLSTTEPQAEPSAPQDTPINARVAESRRDDTGSNGVNETTGSSESAQTDPVTVMTEVEDPSRRGNRLSLTSVSGASLRTISLPPAYRTQRRNSRTEGRSSLETGSSLLGSDTPSSDPGRSGGHDQPPPRQAHVATDDKTVLARMEDLTSAPDGTSDPPEAMNVPRAPEWPEDDQGFVGPSGNLELEPIVPSCPCPGVDAPPEGGELLSASAPPEEHFELVPSAPPEDETPHQSDNPTTDAVASGSNVARPHTLPTYAP
jgi:hypothetical protein